MTPTNICCNNIQNDKYKIYLFHHIYNSLIIKLTFENKDVNSADIKFLQSNTKVGV